MKKSRDIYWLFNLVSIETKGRERERDNHQKRKRGKERSINLIHLVSRLLIFTFPVLISRNELSVLVFVLTEKEMARMETQSLRHRLGSGYEEKHISRSGKKRSRIYSSFEQQQRTHKLASFFLFYSSSCLTSFFLLTIIVPWMSVYGSSWCPSRKIWTQVRETMSQLHLLISSQSVILVVQDVSFARTSISLSLSPTAFVVQMVMLSSMAFCPLLSCLDVLPLLFSFSLHLFHWSLMCIFIPAFYYLLYLCVLQEIEKKMRLNR